jgi:hypothetical protein
VNRVKPIIEAAQASLENGMVTLSFKVGGAWIRGVGGFSVEDKQGFVVVEAKDAPGMVSEHHQEQSEWGTKFWIWGGM